MFTISHFHTLPPTILPTLQKDHTSHHQTQTERLATYLLFWLLSEQCLATSG